MVNNSLEELSAGIWERLTLSAPCDITEVCRYFNIEVLRRPLGSEISAFYLMLPSGRSEIIVNSLDSPKRRRFSIAHELGHHVLNSVHSPIRLLLRSADVKEEERQASEFAACLLMPEHLVVKMYEELDDEPDWRLSIMADRFYVSRPAMLVRLRQLGLSVKNQWHVTEITLQSITPNTANISRLKDLILPLKRS